MRILGLQLGHNATVCLLEDGKIVKAVSQEKFDNIKNSSSFPRDAINWVLSHSKYIDYIAVCGTFILPHQIELTNAKKDFHWNDYLKYWLANKIPSSIYWKLLINKIKRTSNNAKHTLYKVLSEIFELDLNKVKQKTYFIRHHTCHAYAAFYSIRKKRKKEPALIFTLDGSGDYSCATVNVYKDGEIKRIAYSRWIHSIGYIYSNTTIFLGMKALEHEYKVMGLAPYAKESYVRELYEKVFKPVIWLRKDNPLVFDSKIPTNRFIYYLKEKLFGERFDNIAGAVQMLLEELVTEWIRNAINKTGIRTIYTGGGVFMNVKLNKRIMEMPEVEECYFMPSCGDESNPFGAAFYVYKQKTGKDPEPLENLYLGPSYTNQEVEKFIKEHNIDKKYKVEFYEDIEKKVAELLAEFKVVARFKGKAEWGARALGNRSILANPSDMRSFYEVNDAIKQRDFWMPFAPSILDEDMDKYIINPKRVEAPYMILAFDSTPLAREHLKAAMHQADKTLRPQIVYKHQNPDYWRLIKYFKQLTCIGAVLNTSLNLHGYPLVATLEQALFTFENSGLKYLAIENWLIRKEDT